jgi:hypothetical protein
MAVAASTTTRFHSGRIQMGRKANATPGGQVATTYWSDGVLSSAKATYLGERSGQRKKGVGILMR